MGIHSVGLHYSLIFNVFPLSFKIRISVFCVGDAILSEGDVYDIIAAGILKFRRKDIRGLIDTVREELILVL